MIPIPSLDTRSFKEIYENMRLTAGLSGKTEMTYQDPGETLLELFALLFDMQRFYMDQITGEHRVKYARLLSLRPVKMEYAAALMALRVNNHDMAMELEPYTPLEKGEIPFELVPFEENAKVMVSQNEITGFEPVGNKNDQWLVKFKKDLNKFPVWRMYLELENLPEPLTYPIAMWQCEYLSKSGRWEPAHTKDFDGRVKDGFLPVIVDGKMKQESNSYKIRITLTGDDIEIKIKLLSVRINVVKARQAQTVKNYRFTTNGTPNQRIPLGIKNLDENSVKLQIENTGDWELVEDFHASGPTDRHFMVKDGAICFGDHERGEIPPAGSGIVTSCISSLGASGNIPRGALKTKFIENITAAAGGKDSQTDPLAGLPEELNKLHKAVTAEDYETVLREMPVLKLEQIRVIAAEDTTIKIYIKPASDKNDFPKLNETYRKNILAYLEPYRIITTKLDAVSAEYIPFSIELIADFGAQPEDGKSQVIAALTKHFPFQGFSGSQPRRSFGEKITYGDIYRQISAVPQVKTIKSLNLFLADKKNDNRSYIQLKPGELVYMDKIILEHEEERRSND